MRDCVWKEGAPVAGAIWAFASVATVLSVRHVTLSDEDGSPAQLKTIRSGYGPASGEDVLFPADEPGKGVEQPPPNRPVETRRQARRRRRAPA